MQKPWMVKMDAWSKSLRARIRRLLAAALVGQLLEQSFQKLVLGAGAGEAFQGFSQTLSDAILQLAGGGLGKGHDQDFTDGKVPFQDQSKNQPRDGESFSRTGTGFNEAGSGKRALEKIEVGNVIHGRRTLFDRREEARKSQPQDAEIRHRGDCGT